MIKVFSGKRVSVSEKLQSSVRATLYKTDHPTRNKSKSEVRDKRCY